MVPNRDVRVSVQQHSGAGGQRGSGTVKWQRIVAASAAAGRAVLVAVANELLIKLSLGGKGTLRMRAADVVDIRRVVRHPCDTSEEGTDPPK
jgi:hypothetical protein